MSVWFWYKLNRFVCVCVCLIHSRTSLNNQLLHRARHQPSSTDTHSHTTHPFTARRSKTKIISKTFSIILRHPLNSIWDVDNGLVLCILWWWCGWVINRGGYYTTKAINNKMMRWRLHSCSVLQQVKKIDRRKTE